MSELKKPITSAQIVDQTITIEDLASQVAERLLTPDQDDALVGTYGTPSATNRFVTETDPVYTSVTPHIQNTDIHFPRSDVLRSGDKQVVEIINLGVSSSLYFSVDADAFISLGWFLLNIDLFNKNNTTRIANFKVKGYISATGAGESGTIRLQDITNNSTIASITFTEGSPTTKSTPITLPTSGIIEVELQAMKEGKGVTFYICTNPLVEIYLTS